MREILFKAKRKDNGEWVEGIPIKTNIGYFMCYDENPHYCSLYGYMEIDDIVMIDENSICQYTGLTDKNGKRIWENDVILITSDKYGYSNGVGNIEFYEGLWYVDGNIQDSLYDLHRNVEVEVIGNIFDNAELLEVE